MHLRKHHPYISCFLHFALDLDSLFDCNLKRFQTAVKPVELFGLIKLEVASSNLMVYAMLLSRGSRNILNVFWSLRRVNIVISQLFLFRTAGPLKHQTIRTETLRNGPRSIQLKLPKTK